jgi:hypothetical protein
MLRQGVEDFEVLAMLKAKVEELRKRSTDAGDAERMEIQLKKIVEEGITSHTCEKLPNVGEARRKIDRLLVEAQAK